MAGPAALHPLPARLRAVVFAGDRQACSIQPIAGILRIWSATKPSRVMARRGGTAGWRGCAAAGCDADPRRRGSNVASRGHTHRVQHWSRMPR